MVQRVLASLSLSCIDIAIVAVDSPARAYYDRSHQAEPLGSLRVWYRANAGLTSSSRLQVALTVLLDCVA